MSTLVSPVKIPGRVNWCLRDKYGRIKRRGVVHNLIGDVGDNYVASRIYSAAALWTYGMKLDNRATAATKNGAASYSGTGFYITGSAHAMDGTYPKVGVSNNIAQWKCTWSGVALASINSVSLTDNTTDAFEADQTHTFSRAVLASIPITLGTSDTLAVTWTATFTGA